MLDHGQAVWNYKGKEVRRYEDSLLILYLIEFQINMEKIEKIASQFFVHFFGTLFHLIQFQISVEAIDKIAAKFCQNATCPPLPPGTFRWICKKVENH